MLAIFAAKKGHCAGKGGRVLGRLGGREALTIGIYDTLRD